MQDDFSIEYLCEADLCHPLAEAPPVADAPILGAGSNEVKPADAEIAKLATLKLIDFEQARKQAAKRLGIRTSALDAEVMKLRPKSAGDDGAQGRLVELPKIDPWPEAVDGAAVLDDIVAAIVRHVVLPKATGDACALWVVASHAFDSFFVFPRLAVLAPTSECGKTTLVDTIAAMVNKPLRADDMTPAALFRLIEAHRPSVLLDEADTYLGGNDDLRRIINSGHRKGGFVPRCEGDLNEVRLYSTFAPLVISQIGTRPHPTIYNRSVVVLLQRKLKDEQVAEFDAETAAMLHPLARRAARWARDHAITLAHTKPELPNHFHNRTRDNWKPLLAVADAAGGEWPQRARHAAEALARDRNGDEPGSSSEQLLADIREVFDSKHIDRISSDDLTAALVAMEGHPWAEWKGKTLTKHQLAGLLKKFKISSGSIRLPDGRTPKGYHLDAFKEAFERYLSSEPPSQVATTPQPAENCGSAGDSETPHPSAPLFQLATTPQPAENCGSAGDSNSPQADGCGELKSASNPQKTAGCGVVAFPRGGIDAEGMGKLEI